MHYQVPEYRRAINFEERIKRKTYQEILPNLPEKNWKVSSYPYPLRYDTDPLTIASCCLPYCDGSYKTDAVYILECLQLGHPGHRYVVQKGKSNPGWDNEKAQSADRVVYIGSTINLLRRLDEHINDPDDSGAHFTSVYPPVRILNVSWYRNYRSAQKAEKVIADILSKELEGEYVYQQ